MIPRRLMMTADAVGGVWTYAVELAAGLAERGTETLLAVLGPAPDAAQAARAAAVPGLRLEVTGLGLEWQDKIGLPPQRVRRRLLALEAAFSPDRVHVNGYREAAAGFQAPVVLAAHSCVRTWWTACRDEPVPADWDAYAEGVRAGLAAADRIVAPSHAFLAALERAWARLPQGRVVYNGLPVVAGGGDKEPVILAAGRLWDEAKNIRALAKAAPGLPWGIEVAGDGDVPGLRHLGRLPPEALHARMARAAIFASPARYEPFGLAILEAAQHGCALVLGDVPSLRELWDGAARFVPPDDHEALAATLLDVIRDGPAREALQRGARSRARRYTRAAMVAGYLALYAEVGRRRAA